MIPLDCSFYNVWVCNSILSVFGIVFILYTIIRIIIMISWDDFE